MRPSNQLTINNLEAEGSPLQLIAMELFYRDFGGEGKPPAILLHGLLGSSRNWTTLAKLLTPHLHVYGLDQRNHGQSPHANEMDYPTMAKDVIEWMDRLQLEPCHIIGHSMGGKVAMWLACHSPDRIRSLTIADIAPKSYNPHFRIAFEGMKSINPQQFKKISEVEQALAGVIPDQSLRQFLVTNLIRNETGTFDWQINLSGLEEALPLLSDNPINREMIFNGSALLLHGEKSNFVSTSDFPQVKHHFPQCRIVEVPNAGHNVHVENRHFFVQQVLEILELETV